MGALNLLESTRRPGTWAALTACEQMSQRKGLFVLLGPQFPPCVVGWVEDPFQSNGQLWIPLGTHPPPPSPLPLLFLPPPPHPPPPHPATSRNIFVFILSVGTAEQLGQRSVLKMEKWVLSFRELSSPEGLCYLRGLWERVWLRVCLPIIFTLTTVELILLFWSIRLSKQFFDCEYKYFPN